MKDAGNPENALITHAPKYLGITENLTNTRTVIITKGERTGAVDANAGDWVLIGVTKDGWKCGVCYKWSGAAWEETENPQHTQAVLTDALELCRKMGKDEQIPAVQFAKKLVALEAFVENLSAQVVYFQKSVASLVSKTPKVGDQMIYMGHNYRQYDKNEPFSFGIDELAYKGYSEGKQIETWRHLMKTSQIKSLAGASILSLFLTGCIRANGGVELPPGSVASANKLENADIKGTPLTFAVTADGQKVFVYMTISHVFSDDGLKTFRKITPNIKIVHITAYQNKFYTVKENTADYYSSTDGENWTKEGTLEAYQAGDKWYTLFDKTATRLGFINFKTGERKYIYNPPGHIISAPADKPNRVYIVQNKKIAIAADSSYEGFSISLDNGNTWEHADNVLPSLKGQNCNIISHNEVFYFYTPISENNTGYYTSTDGKNWEHQRNDIKNIRKIIATPDGVLLFYPDENDGSFIAENIIQSAKQKIPSVKILNECYYCPQIKSIILAGAKGDYKPFLYIMQTEGILTGSGITSLETADNYIAAQFGNGLQLVAYNGWSCPKPFTGKTYTVDGRLGDRLTIGRWF